MNRPTFPQSKASTPVFTVEPRDPAEFVPGIMVIPALILPQPSDRLVLDDGSTVTVVRRNPCG